MTIVPRPARTVPHWSPLIDGAALTRLASDFKVISSPTRASIVMRLAGGSAELVELSDLPLVRDISRQSLHEGLQALMEHGWVVRDRLNDRDPWVYSLASSDVARAFRKLGLALLETDESARRYVQFLREVTPESVADSRRRPRFCRRCNRLTGWFHAHRTEAGVLNRQVPT